MTLAATIPHGCPSELRLDQLAVGELDDHTLRSHVARCTTCRARYAEIEDAQRTFDVPFVRPRRSARKLWPVAGLAIVAALAVVLAIRPEPPPPETRIKGAGDRLTLFVQHAGEIREAAAGDTVQGGDRLQLTLTLRAARHVVVVGTDGTGKTTRYFETASAIGPSEQFELPYSIVLDATPGREELVAIFCERAPDLAAIDRGVVPADCTTDRIHVVKP